MNWLGRLGELLAAGFWQPLCYHALLRPAKRACWHLCDLCLFLYRLWEKAQRYPARSRHNRAYTLYPYG